MTADGSLHPELPPRVDEVALVIAQVRARRTMADRPDSGYTIEDWTTVMDTDRRMALALMEAFPLLKVRRPDADH